MTPSIAYVLVLVDLATSHSIKLGVASSPGTFSPRKPFSLGCRCALYDLDSGVSETSFGVGARANPDRVDFFCHSSGQINLLKAE